MKATRARRWLLRVAACVVLVVAWFAWQWPASEPLAEADAYRACGFADQRGYAEPVVIGHWRYSLLLVHESSDRGSLSEFRVRREPVTVVARVREWLE